MHKVTAFSAHGKKINQNVLSSVENQYLCKPIIIQTVKNARKRLFFCLASEKSTGKDIHY